MNLETFIPDLCYLTLPLQKSFAFSGFSCCDYMPCYVTLSHAIIIVVTICIIFVVLFFITVLFLWALY